MPKSPSQIVAESFRETDVRPTLQYLAADVGDLLCESLANLDKEIQLLQETLGPVLLSENPAAQPVGFAPPPGSVAEESRRCGLSADVHGIREQVRDVIDRVCNLTKWVETIRSEVRL